MADIRYCGSCVHAEKMPLATNGPRRRRYQDWAQFVLRCIPDDELVAELQYCDRWEASRG